MPRNCISIRSPISRLEPPPSILEMMNVLIAGTNTIVTPDMIPGTESGTTTLNNIETGLHPRSEAASSRLRSIFTITEYSGSIMYGR